MKKLLSILATVGLASTASATVVACGQTSGPKATTRDATVPAKVTVPLIKKYDDKTVLEPADQEALKSQILGALKEANKDCNVNDESFEIKIPADIKKTTTSLEVDVKKTEPKDDKLGLNETSLTVEIKLTDPVKEIAAQGATVKLDLESTEAGQPLAVDDREKLEEEIIKALMEANKNAVVHDDTFSVTIGTTVTPEIKEIMAWNKATESTGKTPGLLPSNNIKVELDLTPIHGRVPAQGDVHIDMEVSTGPADLINDEDKEKLKGLIKDALEAVNSNAVMYEDTFAIELPENLKNGADQKLEVFVHETKGTTEKDGLMNGPVNVTFTLNAFKDKKAARGIDGLNFKLETTHLGEKLTAEDKNNLQAEMLRQLKRVNQDAVILENTFGFEVLDNLIVQKESVVVGVTVEGTESTYDLHGLTTEPALVELILTPDVKDKVKATVPAEPVQINLNETLEGDNLNDADIEIVRDAVKVAVEDANKGSVFNDETFVVETPEEMNTSASTIEVLVHSTDSSIDEPGLEEGKIIVQISLNPMNPVVNPSGANVEFKLEETLIGEEITEKDKKGLEAKVQEQLEEANSMANIESDTFGITGVFDGWNVIEEDTILVHVNATEATNEKYGLKEKWVEVNIKLTLFIGDLNDFVVNKDLHYINENTPDAILKEVEAQNPNVAGDIEVVADSITATEAKIISTNLKKYQGEVTIKFTLRTNIADLLEGQTDLGYVDSADEAKAKVGDVISSHPELTNKVTISDPAEGEIKVTVNEGVDEFQGSVTFIYKVSQDIAEVLKDENPDLGYFETSAAAQAKAEEIVNGFETLNGQVKFELKEEVNQIKALPIDGNESLQGEFTFTYGLSQNVGELLKDKNILEFYVSDEVAKNAVQKVVDEVEALKGKVTVNDPVNGEIKVTVNDDVKDLVGEKTYSYQVSTNLDELIPASLRDLKEVASPDEAMVKANDLIESLGLTGKVTANLEGENQIKVIVGDDSGLKGEAILTFTIQA